MSRNNNLSKFIDKNLDKRTFGNLVNEYMYQKNITTSELCENAGLDRRLISKFVADSNYHPSKETCLAVCIGLKLDSDEARDLLKVCGYSFSNNSQRDLTVAYALDSRVENVREVNNLLNDIHEKLFKE